MNFIKIIFPKLFFIVRYAYKFKKIPNVISPKSFNEKILRRTLVKTENKYHLLSDKYEVKKWVSEKIGSAYVIETLFVGDCLTVNDVRVALKTSECIFVKANHNSGPVYKIDSKTTDAYIEHITENVNKQLEIDYGKIHGEYWYSRIQRKVLIERSLSDLGCDILDYKFHCFNKNGVFNYILHIDFDRSTNHNRSFFDADLNYLPFEVEYPSIVKSIKKPNNLEEMVRLVKELSSDFDYVRVDLYNINGQIFFGEMTFAHGAALEKFRPASYDTWMGELWK